MNGTVQSVTERNGAYGKFSHVMIDGNEYSAFNSHHETVRTLSPGDQVEFAFDTKGKYKHLSSIKRTSGVSAAGVSAAVVQPTANREFLTRDESMITSYAKDLMAHQADMTPELAVNSVFEIIRLVKTKVKENPTS